MNANAARRAHNPAVLRQLNIEALIKMFKPSQCRRILVFFLSIFYIYYLGSIHVLVNNHNDFGEYFIRAELMLEDLSSYWLYGSDKLLSLIELVGLFFFKYDFQKIYLCSAGIIITLLFASSVLFLYSKCPLLPESAFERFLCITLLIFTPTYFFAATSIEQSILASVMLFAFIATCHRSLPGSIFAFLCTLSRPEGIVLLLFYPVALFFLKTTRYKTSSTRGFFLFLFLFFSYNILAWYFHAFVTQEIGILAGYNPTLSHFWTAITTTCRNFILFPLELFKSYFLLFLFILGIIASFFSHTKRFYILLFLLFLGFESFATTAMADMSPYITGWEKILAETGFFPAASSIKAITRAYSTLVVRYNLLIYPVIAIIAVQGLFSCRHVFHAFKRQAASGILLGMPFLLSLLLSIFTFATNPLYHVPEYGNSPYFFGISREEAETAALVRQTSALVAGKSLLYADFLDNVRGSKIAVFNSIAGMSAIYCLYKGPQWATIPGRPESQLYSPEQGIKNGIFRPLLLDIQQSTGGARLEILRRIFEYDHDILLKEGVNIVVSHAPLDLPFLQLAASSEKAYIYLVR